jgi:hypothetical protein
LVDNRPRSGCTDRRPVAHREEEEVNRTDRRELLGAQLALAEVTEVADAQAVQLEAEDRVGPPLGAGDIVVFGGDRDDLADRRLESPGGRAPLIASTPLWSMCSWVTSSSSASTPSIGG